MADKKPKLTIEDASEVEVRAEDRSQTAQTGAADAASKKSNPLTSATGAMRAWLHDAVPGHECAAIGGILGLVVAILVFTIGFWRAFFVALCVVIGVMIGQYVDGNPRIVRVVRKLFSDNRS